MGIGIPGAGLVKKGFEKAKDLGGKAVDAGGQAAGRIKDQVVDKAKDVGGDVVELGAEVSEHIPKPVKDFGKGVGEWGKSSVSTVVGIASNPLDTAKAVGKLATNPVLNPVGGLTVAAIQGKNPVQAYKEGAQQLKGIGEGMVNDYKQVYKDHGAAGIAGYVAPDIVSTILTGGGSTAARAGGTAVAREVAEDVVQDAVTDQVTRRTGKEVAKEVGKEFIPGPEDVADGARKEDNQRQNFLEALIGNFSL